MPHVLIAGTTGSGKSVCINTIIMSILYKAHPDDVKFIMIDPKVVELSVYNGIPHLLCPVVTDPKKAAGALNWAVKEMTDRYQKFADAGVRDMKGFNEKIHNGVITVSDANGNSVDVATAKMPQIVVIVDELADLMMVASNEVEEAICRLAQLARAAGIHLVIATQRPSVDVITGLIKANMPSRIAFAVSSAVDSRTILDMGGAEKLLGKGDMLYYPQGFTKPLRVQGAFVSDNEVSAVVDFIKQHNQPSDEAKEHASKVTSEIEAMPSAGATSISGDDGFDNERDSYFEASARLIVDKEKASIGMLQRNFKIGFNRAARIMDQLEDFGVVGPEEGTKPRKVLLSSAQLEELLGSSDANNL
jgi:S-DNA-T family DNA segregation ATPase FtsK/SpoIIIE